ncbi:hypothetical protein JTM76_33720, partial [Pseudomonas aeruginosa]|nr:hypothetical protein [Pseudomonas aeruginosa]
SGLFTASDGSEKAEDLRRHSVAAATYWEELETLVTHDIDGCALGGYPPSVDKAETKELV